VARRPVEGFVRNAPLAEVQAVLTEAFLPADTFTIPFTVTFVETPQGLVVFDAGTGGQLAPTAGQMHANMRAAGLDPAAVRAVIVSHFHGDHITGLTTAQNAVVFPNAEIVVPAAEWAWFTDASNEARSPEGQRGTFSNVARRFAPLLVNSVVGFIGPEYLFDGKQIIRAGLEDHMCGKLLGLPMGVDICHTNHAEADADDMDVLLTCLATAGVSFVMGVPGADDVMLAYQSTSFHDGLYARRALGKRPAPEFAAWLERMGIGGPGDDAIPPAMSPALIGLG